MPLGNRHGARAVDLHRETDVGVRGEESFQIRRRGPVTEKLQKAFYGLFSGATPDKYGWLDPVDMAAAPRAALA